MDMINKSNPYAGTPLGELMALQFMIRELQLYLDTHSDDKEAFSLLKETLELEREGRKRYTEKYGPILFSDLENLDSYEWIDSPWPWSYGERGR
jgi:spore coat protein JB